MSIEWDDYDSSQDGVAGFSLSMMTITYTGCTIATVYFFSKLFTFSKSNEMHTFTKCAYLVTVIAFYLYVTLAYLAFILYTAGANDWISTFLLYYCTGDSWIYFVGKYCQYVLFLSRLYSSFKGSAYKLLICGKEVWVIYGLFIAQQIMITIWSILLAVEADFWVLLLSALPIIAVDVTIPTYICYLFVKRLATLMKNLTSSSTVGDKHMVLIHTMVRLIVLTLCAGFVTTSGYTIANVRWYYPKEIRWLWILTVYLTIDCLVTIICGSLIFKFTKSEYDRLCIRAHNKAFDIAKGHYLGEESISHFPGYLHQATASPAASTLDDETELQTTTKDVTSTDTATASNTITPATDATSAGDTVTLSPLNMDPNTSLMDSTATTATGTTPVPDDDN